MIFDLQQVSPTLFSLNNFFVQLRFWVVGFIVSDFIFLLFVSSFYLLFSHYLYKYAYFKSIICTFLLAFNCAFLCYGAYIISKLPKDFGSTDSDVNE